MKQTPRFFLFTPIGFSVLPQQIKLPRDLKTLELREDWSYYAPEGVQVAAAVVRVLAKKKKWLGVALPVVEQQLKRQLIWQHGFLPGIFYALWFLITKNRTVKRVSREGLGALENAQAITFGRVWDDERNVVRIVYPVSPIIDILQ